MKNLTINNVRTLMLLLIAFTIIKMCISGCSGCNEQRITLSLEEYNVLKDQVHDLTERNTKLQSTLDMAYFTIDSSLYELKEKSTELENEKIANARRLNRLSQQRQDIVFEVLNDTELLEYFINYFDSIYVIKYTNLENFEFN